MVSECFALIRVGGGFDYVGEAGVIFVGIEVDAGAGEGGGFVDVGNCDGEALADLVGAVRDGDGELIGIVGALVSGAFIVGWGFEGKLAAGGV